MSGDFLMGLKGLWGRNQYCPECWVLPSTVGRGIRDCNTYFWAPSARTWPMQRLCPFTLKKSWSLILGVFLMKIPLKTDMFL